MRIVVALLWCIGLSAHVFAQSPGQAKPAFAPEKSGNSGVQRPLMLNVSLVAQATTCPGGADGAVAASISGGAMPYAYQWNVAGSGPQLSNLSAGTYTLTVTDALGLSATATTSVSSPPPLLAGLVQTQYACFGQSNAVVSATPSGGNGGPYNLLWSNGQENTNTLSGLPAGWIRLRLSDSKGCILQDSLPLVQYDSIAANLLLVSPTCHNASDGIAALNFVAGGAGGGDTTQYNYTWSIADAPNALVLRGIKGDVPYTLTITDFVGCSKVFDFMVAAPPTPVLNLRIDSVSCNGLSDGRATVLGVNHLQAPLTYLWSDGSSLNSIVNQVAGTYSLRITDDKGCTTTTSVTIDEPLPLALAFEADSLRCPSDENGRIQAFPAGGTLPYRYFWSNGATTGSIENLSAGTYTLTLRDAKGCERIDSSVLLAPDSMQIQVDLRSPECFGLSNGRIKIIIGNNVQTPLRFKLNDGAWGGTGTFIGLPAGTYTIAVRNGRTCVQTYTVQLDQPPPLEVDLGPDSTLVLGDSMLIEALINNAFGQSTYTWSSSLRDSIRCADPSECSSVWVRPPLTNVFRLRVRDARGCIGEGDIKIFINKPRGAYVPTAFTPNEDGVNERLQVWGKAGQIDRVTIFRVYDRWGEQLFEQSDMPVNDDAQGWDGRFRGQNCLPGVYVWYAEIRYRDGVREQISGNSTLIR